MQKADRYHSSTTTPLEVVSTCDSHSLLHPIQERRALAATRMEVYIITADTLSSPQTTVVTNEQTSMRSSRIQGF